MDIFNSHFYKTNSFYLKLLGLWPLGDVSNNRIKRVTIISLTISLMIPQVIRLVEEWGNDMDIVIEVIGSLIYFTGSQIKYITCVSVESQMKFLYEEIARHWKTLTSEEEKKILSQYAQDGYDLALGYLISINIILVGYITLPLAPMLLDIIDPLNETRPKAFPYFAEYFIDDQKYYFELTVHGWIVCILSVQIYGTFDATYTQLVQHSCALFAIVEYRLNKATKIEPSISSVKEKDEAIYNEMVDAIIYHKQAIQFVGLIEKCYTFVFFGVITLNTAVVSLAAVDTMLNLDKGNHKQMIRIGLLYIGFSFHLLYNMYPGQKVIDSSTRIQQAA
ncbi:uncharacterized protein LOC100328556 isoform X2 [Nasonia vitripennis]|nr:uncharacterized protein LOC100328556 isoform X2 [Nasonia vitripennis]